MQNPKFEHFFVCIRSVKNWKSWWALTAQTYHWTSSASWMTKMFLERWTGLSQILTDEMEGTSCWNCSPGVSSNCGLLSLGPHFKIALPGRLSASLELEFLLQRGLRVFNKIFTKCPHSEVFLVLFLDQWLKNVIIIYFTEIYWTEWKYSKWWERDHIKY